MFFKIPALIQLFKRKSVIADNHSKSIRRLTRKGDKKVEESMRTFLIITLCLWGVAAPLEAGEESQSSVAILDDGSIALPNNGVVPPYSRNGNWTEMEKKESSRYFIRHFLFMVPNKPPALEIFVTHDRADEPPDGAFEIGLVRGYVSGFASKAGFTFSGLVFEDLAIGATKV